MMVRTRRGEWRQRPFCTDNTISLSRHARPLIRDSLALVLSLTSLTLRFHRPFSVLLSLFPFLVFAHCFSSSYQACIPPIPLAHFSRSASRIALVSRVNPDEKIPWEYTAFQGRAIRAAGVQLNPLRDARRDTTRGVSRPQR